MSALFYRHCGGEVIAGDGQALDRADVEALRGVHFDEIWAAAEAGDRAAGDAAKLRAVELVIAAHRADRWRRASSR